MPPAKAHHGSSSTGLKSLLNSKTDHLHIEPSPIFYRILTKKQPLGQKRFSAEKNDILMESKSAYYVWHGASISPKLAFDIQSIRFADLPNGQTVGLVATMDQPNDHGSGLAVQYYDLYLEGVDAKPFSKFAAWSFNIDTPLTEWTSKDAPSPDRLVVIDVNKFPEVWEEDVRIEWGGIRNPYHRVDAISSARRIQVYALGKDGNQKHLVADTARPNSSPSQSVFALFETGYVTRWYLPKSALEVAEQNGVQLRPAVGTSASGFSESSTRTVCPYKGMAYYHSVTLPDGEILPDVAWSYPDNIPSLDLRGSIAFWSPGNARLQLYVDGELIE